MDMESMAKLMQMFMSSGSDGNSDSDNSGDASPDSDGGTGSDGDNSDDNMFEGFFDNINFDMLSKMGDLFMRMNQPDRNAELLLALKPHLRSENQHKVDSAMKLSRMMSMIPFLKESGILKDLF